MIKNVLITGASKGIGYNTALEFCRQGHSVLAIARSLKKLVDLEEKARLMPGSLYIIEGDISNFKPEWLPEQFQKLHIVIHNAGLLYNKPFTAITGEELRATYEVNVFAPFHLTQLLLPFLSREAHLIYIGSVGGVTGTQKYPGLTAYSSSKAALSCLSECLQAEFGDQGWSFNCLALGAVQTEMLEKAFPGYQAPTTAEEMGEYLVNFALHSGKLVKGKTLLISRSNP